MKTKIVKGQLWGTPMIVPENGELVEFDRDVDHGDWKTALVHKDRWPTITKGTKCKVVGWMQNFYGVHVKVEHGSDVYDVEIHKVKGLKRF